MDVETGAMADSRVEVSGWDRSENFFVEKTTLDWNQEGDKDLALRAEVREGSVLFVRLLKLPWTSTTLPSLIRQEKLPRSIRMDGPACGSRACILALNRPDWKIPR